MARCGRQQRCGLPGQTREGSPAQREPQASHQQASEQTPPAHERKQTHGDEWKHHRRGGSRAFDPTAERCAQPIDLAYGFENDIQCIDHIETTRGNIAKQTFPAFGKRAVCHSSCSSAARSRSNSASVCENKAVGSRILRMNSTTTAAEITAAPMVRPPIARSR